MDRKALGGILEQVGAGLSMFNANPGIRKEGYGRLQDIRDREASAQEAELAAEQEARKIAVGIKTKILQTSIETFQRPDLTPEQRAKIGNDISILSKDLGVDPSSLLSLPQNQPEDIKVGRSVIRKKPDGTYEEVFTAPGNETTPRQSVLRPGAQLVDPSGKVIAENKNPQWNPNPAKATAQGFRQQVRGDVEVKLNEAKTKMEKSGSLGDAVGYGNKYIDKRVADGLMGLGEAQKARDALNGQSKALMDFDSGYKRAIEILDNNPAATTVAADVSKAVTGATSNVLGLMELVPYIEPGLTTAAEDWQDELNQVAGDNRELQSIILGLAIQNAIYTGLADGRMSNQDIERSIAEFGANTRSPGQVKRRLGEMRAKLVGGLKNRIEVTVENFSGLSEQDPAPGLTPDEKAELEQLRKELNGR